MLDIDKVKSKKVLKEKLKQLKGLIKKGKMEEANIDKWLKKKENFQNAKT